MKKRNSGFTLVELSIAIVIIGIILAMVSTLGPSLIEGGHSKALLKQVLDIRVASQQFVERYKMLPGDLPAQNTDFAAGTSAACLVGGAGAGNGDGLISQAESACVGEHLFRAGLISSPQLPADNGVFVVISNTGAQALYAAVVGSAPTLFLPARVRNVIVIRDVSCALALAVDQGLDDGDLAAGNNVINMSPACTGTTRIWLAIAL
jgi:prepilin-type N-terminal cleavage/methylation domain-containing protein